MPTIEELRELIRAGTPLANEPTRPALVRHRFWTVAGKVALAYEIDFDLACDLDFSFTLFKECDGIMTLRVESDIEDCAELSAMFLGWYGSRGFEKEAFAAEFYEVLRTNPAQGGKTFASTARWNKSNIGHHKMLELLGHASTEWKLHTQEKVFWHHNGKDFLVYFPDKSLKTKPEKRVVGVARDSLKWLKEPEVLSRRLAKKNFVMLDMTNECGLEKACREILAEVHD